MTTVTKTQEVPTNAKEFIAKAKTAHKIVGAYHSWTFQIENAEITLSVHNRDFTPTNGRVGQISVVINNQPLKKIYNFVNYNNFGVSPLETVWDNDDSYSNKIGELAKIHLCEYGVGDGGEIRIGKWHAKVVDVEAKTTLSHYRKLVTNYLFY